MTWGSFSSCCNKVARRDKCLESERLRQVCAVRRQNGNGSALSRNSRVGVILQHLWIQAPLTGNGRKIWSCQKCPTKRHNPRTEIRTEVTAVGAGRGRALASCHRYKEPTKWRGNHMEGASLGALCTNCLVARSKGTDSLIVVRILALSLSLSLSLLCSPFLALFCPFSTA